jgi:bacterioferritin (cytochrome b1)
MEGTASFKTDEIIRYPRMIDNLIRDKMTEDQVTALYQTAEFSGGAFSRIQNMALNISSDEVRHSRQFEAMIETLRKTGNDEALLLRPNPEVACREEIQLLHELMRSENDLMHRYLRYVILFSEHQDLSARLFKNSVDHMRHWDKLSGILVRLGDVLQIENASRDSQGVERSTNPMPMVYPGHGRREALESLLPSEKELIVKYEQAIGLMPDGDIKGQLHLHLALTREHVFTQEWLLHNARNIPGLEEK